jgi:hypothetical protein
MNLEQIKKGASFLKHIGMPLGLTITFGLIFAGLSTTTYLLSKSNLKLQEEVRLLDAEIRHNQMVVASKDAKSSELSIPLAQQYTRDVDLLFGVSKEVGLALGAINYKYDHLAQSNLAVYSMNFQLSDEYQNIKYFLSRLQSTLPNCALQEVRIERKDTATLATASIKLALIYRLDDGHAR